MNKEIDACLLFLKQPTKSSPLTPHHWKALKGLNSLKRNVFIRVQNVPMKFVIPDPDINPPDRATKPIVLWK